MNSSGGSVILGGGVEDKKKKPPVGGPDLPEASYNHLRPVITKVLTLKLHHMAVGVVPDHAFDVVLS